MCISYTVVMCICSLLFVCFFFSSRRRHTRCALVTGVQTCALPICPLLISTWNRGTEPFTIAPGDRIAQLLLLPLQRAALQVVDTFEHISRRSEERRVGKECVSTCRSRWSP